MWQAHPQLRWLGSRSGQKKKGGGAPGKTRKSVTSWNGKGPSTDPER